MHNHQSHRLIQPMAKLAVLTAYVLALSVSQFHTLRAEANAVGGRGVAPVGTHKLDGFCTSRKPRDVKQVEALAKGYCNDCRAETNGQCNTTNGDTRTSMFYPLDGDRNLCFDAVKKAELAIDRVCAFRVRLVTPLSDASATGGAPKEVLQLMTENARDLHNSAATAEMQQKIMDRSEREVRQAIVRAVTRARRHCPSSGRRDVEKRRYCERAMDNIPAVGTGDEWALHERFRRLIKDLKEKYQSPFAELAARKKEVRESYIEMRDEMLARAKLLNGGEDIQLGPATAEEVAGRGHNVEDRFVDAGGTTTDPDLDTDPKGDPDLETREGIAASAERDEKSAAAAKAVITRARQLTGAQRIAFEAAVAELGGDDAAAAELARRWGEVGPKYNAALTELNAERAKLLESGLGVTDAEMKSRLAATAERLGVPAMLKKLYMVRDNGEINPVASVLVTDDLYGDGTNFPTYSATADDFIERNLVRGRGKLAGGGLLEFSEPINMEVFGDGELKGNVLTGFSEVRTNFSERLAELQLMDAEVDKTLAYNNDVRKYHLDILDGGSPTSEEFPTLKPLTGLLGDISFKHPEAAAIVATENAAYKPVISAAITDAINSDKDYSAMLRNAEVGLGVGPLFVGGPVGRGLFKGTTYLGSKLGVGSLVGSKALTGANRFFATAGPMLTRTSIGMGLTADTLAVGGYIDALNTVDEAQLALMANPNLKGFELLRDSHRIAADKKLWATVAGVSGTTTLATNGAALLRGSRIIEKADQTSFKAATDLNSSTAAVARAPNSGDRNYREIARALNVEDVRLTEVNDDTLKRLTGIPGANNEGVYSWNHNGKDVFVKVPQDDNQLRNELVMQTILSRSNLGPEVIGVRKIKGSDGLVTGFVEGQHVDGNVWMFLHGQDLSATGIAKLPGEAGDYARAVTPSTLDQLVELRGLISQHNINPVDLQFRMRADGSIAVIDTALWEPNGVRKIGVEGIDDLNQLIEYTRKILAAQD